MNEDSINLSEMIGQGGLHQNKTMNENISKTKIKEIFLKCFSTFIQCRILMAKCEVHYRGCYFNGYDSTRYGSEAHFLAKEDGVVVGIALAEMIFDEVDQSLKRDHVFILQKSEKVILLGPPSCNKVESKISSLSSHSPASCLERKNELIAQRVKERMSSLLSGWQRDDEEFVRFFSEVQNIIYAPNLSIHLERLCLYLRKKRENHIVTIFFK
ncbi:hypothetical protein Scep_012114 [Stephania cephalantha]|uniref:Uncharacterized protein n=1 Tax=Stephania cephalantha TaxID=152367 RepID=A0AAP0JFZ6_9MAGN